MLDAAKMYYSGKVDREIAKYYFGDSVMHKMKILDFSIFCIQIFWAGGVYMEGILLRCKTYPPPGTSGRWIFCGRRV